MVFSLSRLGSAGPASRKTLASVTPVLWQTLGGVFGVHIVREDEAFVDAGSGFNRYTKTRYMYSFFSCDLSLHK